MSDDSIQIPYATPVTRPPPKGWAAASLLFGGLGLIFLGGCFMIGVLMTLDPTVFPPGAVTSKPDRPIGILLLIIAIGCFVGAIWLLILGVSGLLRIIRS